MKTTQYRHGSDDLVEVQQYLASSAEMPPGVKARTTSRGPEAMFQRADGVVFYANEGDWFVRINKGPMFVLDAPSYAELFETPSA